MSKHEHEMYLMELEVEYEPFTNSARKAITVIHQLDVGRLDDQVDQRCRRRRQVRRQCTVVQNSLISQQASK